MLTVAVDTGPLHGPLTGVGRAVTALLDEYALRTTQIDVIPYVVSRRAQLLPGTRRLPIPAFLAMRAWSRMDHPRVDRFVRPAHVVHGTNYVVPPVRCPSVVSVYDTWALRHPESSSPIVNRAMRVLRRNIQAGAVVHASSRATADGLAELFPHATIHVVHLGAPRASVHADRIAGSSPEARTATNAAARPDGGPYVLAVGTIERRKNYPRLIQAFAASEAARSGMRLLIAGGHGDDIERTMTTVEALAPSVRSHVELLGRASDGELEDLYAGAALVAYPSLDEGFGFPILEAMSHGIPVLSSNRGSIPEIAGDAAVLVDPNDIDSIGTELDRIVSDESLRTTLIRRGREQCTRFRWADTADGLIRIYRALHEESAKGR